MHPAISQWVKSSLVQSMTPAQTVSVKQPHSAQCDGSAPAQGTVDSPEHDSSTKLHPHTSHSSAVSSSQLAASPRTTQVG